MHLKGRTVLITGGGSGIGRALGLELAARSCRVTVADYNEEGANTVAREIEQRGGQAQAVCCDVRNDAAQKAMFEKHVSIFGTLDIAFLNAGILGRGDILGEADDGAWAETLDIDLRAQMVGARLAALTMKAAGSKGIILFTASAGGLFPMPVDPPYAAAKAGLINFALSITPPLAAWGIRVCSLCPQPVDTPMVTGGVHMGAAGQQASGKGGAARSKELVSSGWAGKALLTTSQVVQGAMYLLEDDTKLGTVLMLHVSGRAYEWTQHSASLRRVILESKTGTLQPPQLVSKGALRRWAMQPKPELRAKVQVHRLSSDFRAATRVVHEPIPELKPGEVLMRRMFAGVNASDVNFTAGHYFGTPEQSAKLLPFDAGFEAVGVVAAVAPGVKGLKVGDAVAEMTYGAFSEWGPVQAKVALPAPTCAPEVVALLTSGLTASIGLEVAGQMRGDETVLVTAAAGGTGQFVVQLAKAAGNHVVATCGGSEKAALLKKLGADRVINYHEESVKEVLKKEYKKGVNLVWESVGGEMFETCVRALANNGRLVVIGMMSQYGSGWKPSVSTGLLELLLWKSAAVRGFFLPQHSRLYKRHLQALAGQWMQGRLHVSLDASKFIGVDKAADAVEHLQGGSSIGKVILQLAQHLPSDQEEPSSRL